ncbi:MAG: DUF4405 domain-containing protein [Lachnospiraceae bacterium]
MRQLDARCKLLIKIIIDTMMFVLYLFLMFGFGTTLFFHEVAGLGIIILFVLHVILNKIQIKGLIKGKTRSRKNIYHLVTDILLLVGMLVVIISGVFISKYLFSFEMSLPQEVIYKVHKGCSYLCLAILAIHVMLHGNYLVGAVKNIYKNKYATYVRRTFAGVVCISVIVVFIYNQVQIVVDKKMEVVIDQEGEVLDEMQNPPESLEDYLGGLTCRGCVKSCSLLALQCHSGEREVETFTQKYYELYETEEISGNA